MLTRNQVNTFFKIILFFPAQAFKKLNYSKVNSRQKNDFKDIFQQKQDFVKILILGSD